jgi:hypothetical protein
VSVFHDGRVRGELGPRKVPVSRAGNRIRRARVEPR